MGSCVGAQGAGQLSKRYTFKKAHELFFKIANSSSNVIDKDAVDLYFKDYSDSCYEILTREIDFNNDGKITQNEWMAYWEYIRKSGYDVKKINQQLKRIQAGDVSLSFPKAKSYESNQPRITLMNNIMKGLKQDKQTVSFLQDVPEEEE